MFRGFEGAISTSPPMRSLHVTTLRGMPFAAGMSVTWRELFDWSRRAVFPLCYLNPKEWLFSSLQSEMRLPVREGVGGGCYLYDLKCAGFAFQAFGFPLTAGKPQTPSPKPQAPSPKPQAPSPKPQAPSPKPQTPNPKPEPQTPNPKPQTLNPYNTPVKPQKPQSPGEDLMGQLENRLQTSLAEPKKIAALAGALGGQWGGVWGLGFRV